METCTTVVAPDGGPWRRYFRGRDDFLLAQAALPDLLPCSQRAAPCVLILGLPEFEYLGNTDLLHVTDFGRSIQMLVTGPPLDEAAREILIRRGAMGYVEAGAGAAEWRKAVRAVARGEFWAERRLLTRLLQQFLYCVDSPKLTPRERDILRLIATGHTNRSIAEKLCITHETVRWHIRGLHSKLGLQDRLGTALYAQQYLRE